MTILRLRRLAPSGVTHDAERWADPEPPPSPDDQVMMARIARGDVAALDELLQRYWGPLTAYASRILGDRDSGKDVVQTAFIRLWHRRAEWRPGSVRAFLFRLTRNLCFDDARQEAVRGRLSGQVRDVFSRPARTPAEDLDAAETKVAVDRAIQLLPPRRREVFVLAHLRGLTYAEVARVMGISLGTVSNQMVAALHELRERLRPLAPRSDRTA